jgi:hypothetical protein
MTSSIKSRPILFREPGGLPRETVFVGKDRLYNRRFLQMCSHYLVDPVACTPASGWEKGQVENQVGLVRERFFIPRLRFKNLDELNAWLIDQCILTGAGVPTNFGSRVAGICHGFEAERPKFRQASLQLRKRTIRLFRYKFLNQICMWLEQESLVSAEFFWADTARIALTPDTDLFRPRRGQINGKGQVLYCLSNTHRRQIGQGRTHRICLWRRQRRPTPDPTCNLVDGEMKMKNPMYINNEERAALLSDLKLLIADLENNKLGFSHRFFRYFKKVLSDVKLTRSSYEPWRSRAWSDVMDGKRDSASSVQKVTVALPR